MRLLTLCILFLPGFIFAGTLDSLDRLISKSKGAKQNELLAYKYKLLGDSANNHKNYDSAIYYHEKAVEYAKVSDNVVLLGRCYNNLGIAQFGKQEYAQSFASSNAALEIFLEYGDDYELATTYLNTGISYNKRGVSDKALDLLLNAQRLFEKLNHKDRLSRTYNAIGNIYKSMNAPEYWIKALEYHRKAIKLRKNTGDIEGLSSSYNSIGNAFALLKNYDSALYYFQRSLYIKTTIHDSEGVANTCSNMGEVYFATGDLARAKDYFEKAYKIRLSKNFKEDLPFSYINLAELSISQKRYVQAIRELLSGVEVAIKTKNFKHQKKLYRLLKETYQNQKKFPEAIKYADLYTIATDSLAEHERVKEIEKLRLGFQTEVLTKENENLIQRTLFIETKIKLQEQELQVKNVIGISLIIGSVFLGIWFFYIYVNKKKEAEQSRKEAEQNELIISQQKALVKQSETHLKEMHHRIKNNLQVLSALLSAQSLRLTDPQAIEAVKASKSRVNAMTMIHLKLYNEDSTAFVNMKSYIDELIKELRSIYGYTNSNIEVKCSVDEEGLDVDRAISVGLILNELISNAFKYAFPDHDTPRLWVSFIQVDHNSWQLKVADNGTTPIAESKKESYGLNMVNLLCKQLNATMNIDNRNGLSYEIVL